MYDYIGSECVRYLTCTVNPRLLVALECSTSALLEELGRRWRHYQTLAQSVGTMFHHLDINHTSRERIPAVNPRTARKGKHSGGPLALAEVAFRDTVLKHLGEDRLDVLRTAVRRRDGSPGCDWANIDDLFERIGFGRLLTDETLHRTGRVVYETLHDLTRTMPMTAATVDAATSRVVVESSAWQSQTPPPTPPPAQSQARTQARTQS